MKRLLASLALTGLVLPMAVLADKQEEKKPKAIPNQYIVVLKDDADVDAVSADVVKKFPKGQMMQMYKHALKGFAIALSSDQIDALRADDRVVAVSPDYEVSMDAKSGPTIEAQSLPTGIDRINAELSARDGTGIEVAVIDTGIDTSHPDLKANILGGKNCSTGKPTAYQDGNGHGTHVAGTIAAIKNTVGVVGVAPAAKLWAVRVLDNSGNGSWSSVICGIDFVTSQASHIKVANMSLGGTGTSDVCGLSTTSALHAAICRSVAAGVTYVVAAGNENDDVKNHVPAAYPEVIAVSALADSNGKSCGAGSATSYGADDTFASFSNYATLATDLARIIGAPGVNIYSTWKGGGYNTISGTSMATPHVAGAAALYLQTHPTATPTQVKTALLAAGEAKDTNVNGECATGIFSHVSSTKHPEAVLRTEGL